MTLALTVILIESTANTSFGLPLMMSLLIAKWVGDLFNHGILEIAIEAKVRKRKENVIFCPFPPLKLNSREFLFLVGTLLLHFANSRLAT